MASRLITCLAVAALAAPALAAPNYFEDFEDGSSGWTRWPSATDSFIRDTAHNHTPGGNWAAKTPESDPASWAAYADFGATSGFVKATVWVFEDRNNDGTDGSRPVTNMLALIGAGTPGSFNGDYLQLGVVPFYSSGSTHYGFRTLWGDNNGQGMPSTGVQRKAGWTKLSIEADAIADGGQVRFYIDDALVGTSQRSSDLQYVRIGNNNKSYENFWYDDLSVVPEPASLLLVALGGLGLVARRRVARI